MDITSAQYVNHPTTNRRDAIKAVIDGETWIIPLETGNTHYDEIMKQVAAGELTIADAD